VSTPIDGAHHRTDASRGVVVRRSPVLGLVLATAVVSGVTLLLYPISDLDPGVSSGVLYVLGVLLLAIYADSMIALPP
jgi:hypothetical protein